MVNKEALGSFEEKLAHQHWNYVRQILEAHGEDREVIEKVGFHYRSAMVHGFKHGVESIKEMYSE